MQLKRITIQRFGGFRDFSLDVDDVTVLVGLNNSGKTTLLRSVKIACEAIAAVFGTPAQPQVQQLSNASPGVALQKIAGMVGVFDLNSLYFNKDRREDSVVTLDFLAEQSTISIRVKCLGASNNVHVEVSQDGVKVSDLDEDASRRVLALLFKVSAEFVPPPGTVSPTEPVLTWDTLQGQIREGKYAETWRNQLHWASEGKPPELFQRVVDRVREYVGPVDVAPPRRSRQQAIVEVPYAENGVEYDIASSGAGLRTIFSLAAAIELSDARILLFDEPDSHLHSSLQREVATFLCNASSNERQIIIATHSPDFIEEVAVETLVWIDRSEDAGRKCDEVGKTLVDLGAVSHSEALAFIGADTILYFENKPDRKALTEVLARCGKKDLLDRARLESLGGFGDATKLPGVLDLIRRLRGPRIAMVAILDADYTQPLPTGSSDVVGGVLMIRLPCKELENLLLLSPESVANAAVEAADRRSQYTHAEVATPSVADVEEQIDKLSELNEIKNALKPHWMCQWARQQDINLNDEGQLKRADDKFEKHWLEPDWRRRCCPGKEILKRLRRWLQNEYGLSVGLTLFFKHYDPTPELLGLIEALESHVHDQLME